MQDGVGSEAQEEAGEIEVIEPHLDEVASKLDAGRVLVDGKHLGAGTDLQALDQPTPGPAGRSGDQDALHPDRLPRPVTRNCGVAGVGRGVQTVPASCYRRCLMQALLYETDPGAAASVVQLADEMAEDPRCRVLVMGADEEGTVLLSMWDEELVDEVEAGLRERSGRVRRLAVPEAAATWR